MTKTCFGIIGGGFGYDVIRNSVNLGKNFILTGAYYGKSKTKIYENDGTEIIFTEVEGLLAHPAIDVIIIATPPRTHLNLIERALDSSVSKVYCEKPVGSSLQETLKIQELNINGGFRVQPSLQYRYEDGIVRLRKLVTEESLEMSEISVQWKLEKRDKHNWKSIANEKSSILDDLGIHVIDYIQYIISGESDKLDIEDVDIHTICNDSSEVARLNMKINGIKIDVSLERKTNQREIKHQVNIKSLKNNLLWVHKKPFFHGSDEIFYKQNDVTLEKYSVPTNFINMDSRIPAYYNMLNTELEFENKSSLDRLIKIKKLWSNNAE